ncbi:hypothetical protein ACF1FX_32025 [Streptomyces sp. NPDC014646]|uniref:hypothetical protein n=1 Tax=unclassified Streptomyces TaxID=2593676 RepID=UPI0036F59374
MSRATPSWSSLMLVPFAAARQNRSTSSMSEGVAQRMRGSSMARAKQTVSPLDQRHFDAGASWTLGTRRALPPGPACFSLLVPTHRR